VKLNRDGEVVYEQLAGALVAQADRRLSVARTETDKDPLPESDLLNWLAGLSDDDGRRVLFLLHLSRCAFRLRRAYWAGGVLPIECLLDADRDRP
jgi:hypothetical protein